MYLGLQERNQIQYQYMIDTIGKHYILAMCSITITKRCIKLCYLG